ncbi:MAG: TetR/AcrR family transcriptional regulator [Clostridia bacterium]|nr:TetR/AcrR family transcriptional regulator [Clostridia bacterium]MBR2176140.1 TetR/AcrR family transcriptional regulator [Clostridia bacterium]
MPPKAKFTKEEIINAGLAILRERDISSVTAREIGKYLGSSARPIFTVFDNMGEVIDGIEDKAREIYSEYVCLGLQNDIAFKGVGQAYISFAINEPKLFQLLFMREQSSDIALSEILPEIDDNYLAILKSITDQYPVSTDDAVILYRHLWIYSHGIATLCATSMCHFTGEEISIMLTEVFKALLTERLKGKLK